MRQAMFTICLWDLKIILMKKQVVLVFVITGLLVACSKDNSVSESEEANTLFTLISPEYSGVDFENTIIETAEQNHLVNDMLIAGHGKLAANWELDGFRAPERWWFKS